MANVGTSVCLDEVQIQKLLNLALEDEQTTSERITVYVQFCGFGLSFADQVLG